MKKLLKAKRKNAKTITKCYGSICEQDPQARNLETSERIETHWV